MIKKKKIKKYNCYYCNKITKSKKIAYYKSKKICQRCYFRIVKPRKVRTNRWGILCDL